MLFMRWAKARPTSAVSAWFILVNSISGLLGNLSSTKEIPLYAIPLAVAAASGGAAGSYLGSQRFSLGFIKKLLAIVLIMAGGKLVLT